MPHTEMIINHVPGEECRIAIAEDGKLEEFYQERASTQSHVGNIYKGRVTNVEPAIQAAFVDFGLERNGFLHITDLHPKYFPGEDREAFEKVGKKTARHERPPIQKCLKRGQEVLVQVLKEGLSTKGPTVTSYLSIPGRFLVMMPDMQRLGVSRKVEDDDARKEMRDILKTLDPPKDFGFIVRTAGIGQTKTDLKRDLSYLARLWKDIETKRRARGRVGELYAESDLVIRTIRDVFSGDIDRIICDDPVAARRARDFLAVANPRTKSKVVYYDDPVPVFDRTGIEPQIAHINSREVPLPSGGALVIDSTEALVAIDVNSGKSRAARDAETNAYKTNLEAVDEIARQLRLRDLGGLVVLDLIDMRPAKNRKTVEGRFKANLKKDRARTRIGAISQFGLLEMTRQRMRPSLKSSIYNECAHCTGRGYAMSPESVVLSVMRQLALVMHRDDVARIELTISPDVAFHILNRKRGELVDLESRHGKRVMVRVGGGTMDHIGLAAFNAAGGIAPVQLRPGKLSKADEERIFHELDDSDLPEPEPEEDLDDTFFADKEADKGDRAESAAGGETESRAADGGDDAPTGGPRKRRRRRGRGRGEPCDDESEDGGGSAPDDAEASADDREADETRPEGGSGRRRRGRGRGRGRTDGVEPEPAEATQADAENRPDPVDDDGPSESGGRRRRRRRRGRGAATDAEANSEHEPPAADEAEVSGDGDRTPEAAETPEPRDGVSDDDGPSTRRRRRRRRGRAGGDDDNTGGGSESGDDTELVMPASEPDPDAEPATGSEAGDDSDAPAPIRRTRRSRSRRKSAVVDEGADVSATALAESEPAHAVSAAPTTDGASTADDDAAPRSRRRRGRKRSVKPAETETADLEPDGNRNTAPEATPVDIDGNVTRSESRTDAEAAPSENPSTAKKPPRRPGRGYSNRVVY